MGTMSLTACGSFIQPGTTKQEVLRHFGEPDLNMVTCTPSRCTENEWRGRWVGNPPFTGRALWRYYRSKALFHDYVPAGALLEITFTPNASVSFWSFRDIFTGQAIPLAGTIEQADAWRKRNCDPPPRIDVAGSLMVQTTKAAEVRNIFGLPQRTRGGAEAGTEIWTYFAGAPSPLLRPPRWLDIYLDLNGVVVMTVPTAHYGCGAL